MKSIFVLSLTLTAIANCLSLSQYPTCGSCWCIPDENGEAECPSDWIPISNYNQETVEAYLNTKPVSIYTLECNPYSNSTCMTTPVQILLDSESSVCAYKYSKGTGDCFNYSMVTYATEEDAINDGADLTHTGSCGLCSTTQDLATYLVEDFTSAGKICATKGLFNETEGLKCYEDIGLTHECAKIWNYDGIYDGEVCGSICLKNLQAPNNGPPPECALNECLQCDEDKAGPVFSAFAGRTRRRSGLLSEIVRSCSSIAQIEHVPCSIQS